MLKLNRIKFLLAIFIVFESGQLFAQKLRDDRIDECSGLAVSSKNDNLLWLHNDSGDFSRIFLINNSGKTQAVFNYNAKVVDCEDIALYAPKNATPQLFVGDIGDNKAKRDHISIYRFDEPDPTTKSLDEIPVKGVEELKFRYPDGPRDAECLMVDEHDQKIYIISKREDSVGVYSAPLNSPVGKINILKKEEKLFFPGPFGPKWITAGDISRDGKRVLVKSYMFVFYWDRKPDDTIPQCLKGAFKELPYKPEPQGEAIGFCHDGESYYTISEGKFASIYWKRI
ncbi:MAG: hypothetical protein IE931_07895 [Sphingobacteriales bacterium]|nr:hypothetical protein [Sphingobacteriales bacterium]